MSRVPYLTSERAPSNVAALVTMSNGQAQATRIDGALLKRWTSTHTDAIQAAIDGIAATADGGAGGTVLIRQGASPYLVATPIVGKSGVVLKGEGHSGRDDQSSYNSLGTVLKSNQASLSAVINAPYDTTNYSTKCVGFRVEDLTVDGNSKQAQVGISSEAWDFSMFAVTIRQATTGWEPDDAGVGAGKAQRANHCQIWDCTTGIDVLAGTTDGSIVDCRVLGCDTRSIKIRAGGWIIEGCHLTMAGTGTDNTDLELTGSSPAGIIVGNYFDTCGTANLLISGVQAMVSGNYFKSGTGTSATEMIKVTSSGRISIIGNFFNSGVNCVNWVKFTNAGPQAVAVVGNTGTLPSGSLIAKSDGTDYEATNNSNVYVQGNRGI